MTFDPLMVPVATQIIGESLPISSSGHMMLAWAMLERFGKAAVQVPDFFDHFLHGPTIIIIALYFFNAWWALVRMLMAAMRAWAHGGCWYATLRASHKRMLGMVVYVAWLVAIADIITAICYVFVHVMFKNTHFLHSLPMLLIGFSLTSVILLSSRGLREGTEKITASKALILGLVQGLALLPGISRFACTVIIAQWLGISTRRALQFSFLMFFPLIVAAFFVNGLPAFIKDSSARIFILPQWLVVYAVAAIVAYGLFVIACCMVQRKQLWWFGLYMIFPISLVVLLLVG